MKSKYKAIPIKAAKAIAEAYDKDMVIILTYDKQHDLEHVTTFGKTVADCEQAAEGGNALKRALGWPESLCDATPSRMQKKLDEAYNRGYKEALQNQMLLQQAVHQGLKDRHET